jgi:hypothetical protein
MTTANDWTINMPKDGFPELVKLYELVGNTQDVQLITGAHFPHNYNHVTRVAMYGWMNRLFKLGMSEPILEDDFELLRAAELTVWDDQHPRPDLGLESEQKFLATWAAEIDQSLRVLDDDSSEIREEKLKLIRDGWKSITAWADSLRGHLATSGTVKRESGTENANAADVIISAGNSEDTAGLIELQKQIPVSGDETNRSTWSMTALDPVTGDAYAEAPVVRNPRPAAAYTYGYNAPPTVRRLGVALDGLDEVRASGAQRIRLVASDDQIMLAALAAVHSPDLIESVVWVTGNAEYDPLYNVTAIRDPQFIPNGLRYQSLDGLKAILGERFTVVQQ